MAFLTEFMSDKNLHDKLTKLDSRFHAFMVDLELIRRRYHFKVQRFDKFLETSDFENIEIVRKDLSILRELHEGVVRPNITILASSNEGIDLISAMISTASGDQKNLDRDVLINLEALWALAIKLHKLYNSQRRIISSIESRNSSPNKKYLKRDLESLQKNLILEGELLDRESNEISQAIKSIESSLAHYNSEEVQLKKFVAYLMTLPPEQRRAEYYQFMKGKSPEIMKRMIRIRKEISRQRMPVYKAILDAVKLTKTEFPAFRGVLLFGSFPRGKVTPSDIDCICISDKDTHNIGDYFVRKLSELSGMKINPLSLLSLQNLRSWNNLAQKGLQRGDSISASGEMRTLLPYKLKGYNFIGDNKAKSIVTQAIERVQKE